MLKELRIDGQQREDAGGPPRWAWGVGAGALALAALGAAGWWWQSSHQPQAVRTATLAANGASAGANAVLQATGYVTARRRATVSAQITGTLTQVLIEEGDRVQKGQVLARLDDTALRAALAWAEANASISQASIELSRAQLSQADAYALRKS